MKSIHITDLLHKKLEQYKIDNDDIKSIKEAVDLLLTEILDIKERNI